MSKTLASAGGTRLAATMMIVLLTSACSDQAATAPEIPALPGPLAAKNGPNSAPAAGRIFFSSTTTGNYELYSVNPDGSDLRRLTYTTSREEAPSISNDGKKLVYIRQEQTGLPELWTANADGSRPRRLLSHPPEAGMLYRPRWSPDGRRIAFGFQETSTLKMRVAVMDANGGSFTVLTTGDDTGMMPSWSPDGREIAFWAYTFGVVGGDIFTMNGDGTNRQQRTNVDANQYFCCGYAEWSPDGTRILFSMTDKTTGDNQVHTLRVSDWSSLPIGLMNTVFGIPSWSPDGTRIVYNTTSGLTWAFANGYGATSFLPGMDANGWSWSR